MPPQPSSPAGPVDQLTTPSTRIRPSVSRNAGPPESPTQAPNPERSPHTRGFCRMITGEPDWLQKLRLRWMQPNPSRFLRPDGHRFIRPDGDRFLHHDHARFDLLDALVRKYSPDQPRVPAGNLDGGQWASGAGNDAGSNDGDFDKDRYLNKHIIDNHVAKTDEELKERIRKAQIRGLFFTVGMDRNGSFDSVESARDFIKRTLDNNSDAVSMVASGRSPDAFVTWRFGYETGKEAFLETPGSDIRVRKTYSVGVFIAHDTSSEFGYRIISAYPRNFNLRIGR